MRNCGTWVAQTLNSIQLAVFGLLVLASAPALAQNTAPLTQRLELPMHYRFINGTARLWVSISIGSGTAVEALLDTGSVGLLALSTAIADTGDLPDLGAFQTSFGSGDTLIGRQTHAEVSLGDASADMPFAVITATDCIAQRPDCAANKMSFDDYRIANEGIVGEGFKAILGIGPGRSTAGHPLASIGVSRWIVIIPIPGRQEVGKLILNPDDSELAGFKMLDAGVAFSGPQGMVGGAFPGCLIVRSTGEQVCGPMCLDTGAAGLALVTPDKRQFKRVQAGAQFTFQFGGEEDKLRFDIDIPPVGFTLLPDEPDPKSPRQILFAGIRPYLFYEVLYDSDNAHVGLKPR